MNYLETGVLGRIISHIKIPGISTVEKTTKSTITQKESTADTIPKAP